MFESFGKIPRLLNMPMVISEKIDGSNAQIYIDHTCNISKEDYKFNLAQGPYIDGTDLCILAGSRSRWIVPGNDNFGFASWVKDNQNDLFSLGIGRHFGEWWGQGIQRGYGLKEKRFSLFNTSKWSVERPKCCGVVPVLSTGIFSTEGVEHDKYRLSKKGSHAVPGYMNPEGIVIYLPKANMLFKSTFDNDDLPKGLTEVKDVTG